MYWGQQSGLHLTRRDLRGMVREWRSNEVLYRTLNGLFHEDLRTAGWRGDDRLLRHPPCPKDVIPEEYMLQTVYLYVARKRGQKAEQDSKKFCSFEVRRSVAPRKPTPPVVPPPLSSPSAARPPARQVYKKAACPKCGVRHVCRSAVLVADEDSCRDVFDKPRRAFSQHTLFLRKVRRAIHFSRPLPPRT